MNFSIDGSDTWDSTPAQDIFIRNYFTKKEPLNVTKKSRKRKKHPPSSHTASSSVLSNYLEKKTLNEMPKVKNSNKKSKLISPGSLETFSAKCYNEDNETRKNVTTNFVNKSLEKNFEVFKSSKMGSPKTKKFSQKFSKNETSDCKTDYQNDVNMIDKTSKIDVQNNNSPSKKVNRKKNNSNIGQTSQIQNNSSVAEGNFEMKTTKNTFCSNKKYLNNDCSDDFKNKVIQSKLLNLKKRKLKKKNISQIHNKQLSSVSNLKTKMTKNTSYPKENCLNADDSENEILQSELKNLKKRKSKTNKASQIDESVDSEDEVSQSYLQNKRKSKSIQFSQSDESDYSEDEVTQREMQYRKKRISKTTKASQIDESVDSEDKVPWIQLQNKNNKRKSKTIQSLLIDESDDSEDEVIHSKLQNLKKSKINKATQITKISSATKSNFQTKQVKNTSKSKEDRLIVNDSDVSEEDEVIRTELQNSRMFLKIQKLMKLAPHLNPNFVKDSADEKNNSSYDEISTENSSSESDGECSSEGDDEVLKYNKRDSPGGHSEDSLNSKEEDSSDHEEKYVGSLESHRTTSKQEIPIPLLETCSQKVSNVKKPNSLLEKARAKLAAAKFRFLNEKLYTESGGEAFRYFQENKEEFEDYHLGYGQQVSKWPLNPVDVILVDLQKMKKGAAIADLGCGDAKIARVLNNRAVHSFDLVAKHKCVTACDMSRVPLPDSSVDVAVFCLSLMGVNLVDYLREAYRILKMGGALKIAEVESRIENLDTFIASLNSLGFVLERKNTKNKLFVFLDLKKEKKGKASKAPPIALRPCLYKKR